MNTFVVEFLNTSSYIAALLMLVLGGVTVVGGLVFAVYFLLNVIYRNGKGSVYFFRYLRHEKKFIAWYNETKPHVLKGEIKKEEPK